MKASRRNTLAKLLSAVGFSNYGKSSPRQRGDYTLGTLEDRRLMSAVIEGSQGDDLFIISVEDDNVIHLNYNGFVEVVNAPSDGFITVSGYGGNDRFILQNTGQVRFTLAGFAGDDEYTIGQGDLAADIRRDVVISENVISPNHGGRDKVTIDDSLGNGTLYTVDDREIRITSVSSPVIHCNMSPVEDSVTLVASNGNDVVEVRKMTENLHINLGAGNDTIDFGGPDHIVEPSFKGGSSIEPGSGDDLMIIDDSSASSDRTNINIEQVSATVGQPRWMVLDNIGVTGFFDRMRIKTHALVDNQPEVVTFSGRDCPAGNVAIFGNDGSDKVLIGSFLDPIFAAELYTSQIALTLGSGDNQVEVNESDLAQGHSWNVFEDRLVTGILTIKNQPPTVGSQGVANVLVRGSKFNDNFNIIKAGLPWNVTLSGGQGDDTLKQTPLLQPIGGKYDLDDNFIGYVKFDGGAGEDSVILSDLDDELGDADQYSISRTNIMKANFNEDFFENILEMSFVDRVTLYCDDDTNNIQLDLGAFSYAEIFAGGGDDRFINKSANVIPSNVFVNSLALLARLHGQDGNDTLQLDDGSGGAGTYDLAPAVFQYTRDNITRAVEFDSFSRIDINGSEAANTAILRGKPQGAVMNFAVNGGDDTFIVGGGDIDASGLHNATLLGGFGDDKIVFDDSLDDHASFDADVLTLEFQKATKDGVAILYGGFESQKVITSGVMNGSVAYPNTVRVFGIDMPTEICDSPGQRWTEVEIGNGPFGLSQVLAPVKLTSVDSMDLKVFDTLSTFNKQFVVNATSIRQNNTPSTLNIEYSGVGAINILAGNTNDQFIIEAVAEGKTVFVDGGGGDDLVSVGNGTFANILGKVHFAGGAGTNDKIVFSNLFDSASAPITSTLTSFSFKVDGGPLHQFFNGVEGVQVAVSGSGGSTLNMQSVPLAVTVTGGTGDDRINIKNMMSNLTFNGGGEVEGDSVYIDDTATAENRIYIFNGNSMLQSGGSLNFTGLEKVNIQAGRGHDTFDINSNSLDLHLFGNNGNDTFNVYDSTTFVKVNTGAEEFNAFSPVGDSIAINNDNASPGDVPGLVRIDQDDTIFHLQIGRNGVLRIENNAVLCKTTSQFQLPIFNSGAIDLAGGALLHRQDGLNNPFRQWITAGRNGGLWNGTSTTGAINSSLAASTVDADGVGYGTGAQVGMTTIGSFTIEAGDMLVRHALSGDADLNGKVDIADFARTATKFNQNTALWTDGDYNYDGVTDIGDFASLASNFNTTVEIGRSAPIPPTSGQSKFDVESVVERLVF